MTDTSVDRARACVGAKFRSQGRSPDLGLDCLGLVLHAHTLPPHVAPADYTLRGDYLVEADREFQKNFRRVNRPQLRAGDVLLFRVARDQIHLAIHCGSSFVHADVVIGRVVETPGMAAWPLVRVFRRRKHRGR